MLFKVRDWYFLRKSIKQSIVRIAYLGILWGRLLCFLSSQCYSRRHIQNQLDLGMNRYHHK